MSATRFHTHTKPRAKLYFYISWSLSFWTATLKTTDSAPNDSKHSLTSQLSQSTPWTRIRETKMQFHPLPTSAIGGLWLTSRPGRFTSEHGKWYPLKMRLGEYQSQLGRLFLKINISCPCRHSNTEQPSPQRVPVPTTLPWLHKDYILSVFSFRLEQMSNRRIMVAYSRQIGLDSMATSILLADLRCFINISEYAQTVYKNIHYPPYNN
jgi:hypothetical protein